MRTQVCIYIVSWLSVSVNYILPAMHHNRQSVCILTGNVYTWYHDNHWIHHLLWHLCTQHHTTCTGCTNCILTDGPYTCILYYGQSLLYCTMTATGYKIYHDIYAHCKIQLVCTHYILTCLWQPVCIHCIMTATGYTTRLYELYQ